MTEDIFEIQNRWLADMKAAYEAGVLNNPVYKPYFQWKFYKAGFSVFTSEILREMAETCTDEMIALDEKHPGCYDMLTTIPTLDDIYKPYRGYDEDAKKFAYLSIIDDELVNLRILFHEKEL